MDRQNANALAVDIVNGEIKELIDILATADGDREITEVFDEKTGALQSRKFGKMDAYSLSDRAAFAIGKNLRTLKRAWADIEAIKDEHIQKVTATEEHPEGATEIKKDDPIYSKFMQKWNATLRQKTTVCLHALKSTAIYNDKVPEDKRRLIPPGVHSAICIFVVQE